MDTGNLSTFLHHLTRQMAAEALTGQSDQQLVEKALAGRDEAVFRAIVQRHGAIAAFFGIALCAVWLILRRNGGEKRALRPLTITIGLVALQGALGIVQYQAKLPAELVWVHVALATLTWLSVLWTVASAGRLAPRTAPAQEPRAPEPELAGVG